MEKCKNRAEVYYCRLQAGLWQEANTQSLDGASPAETPSAGFDDKSTTEPESNASQTLQAAYSRWGHTAFSWPLVSGSPHDLLAVVLCPFLIFV